MKRFGIYLICFKVSWEENESAEFRPHNKHHSLLSGALNFES